MYQITATLVMVVVVDMGTMLRKAWQRRKHVLGKRVGLALALWTLTLRWSWMRR